MTDPHPSDLNAHLPPSFSRALLRKSSHYALSPASFASKVSCPTSQGAQHSIGNLAPNPYISPHDYTSLQQRPKQRGLSSKIPCSKDTISLRTESFHGFKSRYPPNAHHRPASRSSAHAQREPHPSTLSRKAERTEGSKRFSRRQRMTHRRRVIANRRVAWQTTGDGRHTGSALIITTVI